MKRLFVIAGEASADRHAANVVSALKKRYPKLEVAGVGGPDLRALGMDILVDSNALSILGFAELATKADQIIRSYNKVTKNIREQEYDAALLVDLPDFNLAVAKKLRAKGVPVAYYISPQVWVWRKYRVKKIQKRIDKMYVVFPFETKFYEEHNVPCEFVGHPLLDDVKQRPAYRSHQEISSAPRVAVLPGSRRSEMKNHAPLLREILSKLSEKFENISFEVPVAKNLSTSQIDEIIEGYPVRVSRDGLPRVVSRNDIALVASGTAALETALVGTPQVAYYKVKTFEALLFKALSSYSGHYVLPNIILGREAIREFIQGDATVDPIVAQVSELIQNEDARNTQVESFQEIRAMLGEGGAADRVAASLSEWTAGKRMNQNEKGFSGIPEYAH